MAEQGVIELGSFALHSRLGQGGMGEVWRGVHRQQGVPVALKVMTGEQAREALFREAFLNEVRAVAGLSHPGVVMVLDHGAVDARAQQQSGGRLLEGSPWLAMELASCGSLEQLRLPLRWGELRHVLLALLDALAHAHAHGVIHRDLKPANVLLSSRRDHRPGLKLTDFGIAFALEQTRGALHDQTMGTPEYMAPEQLRGQWRDYGPWTDLYALGCVTWEWLTGAPPFAGNFIHLAHQHLTAAPPPLHLPEDIPAGMVDWVMRLLEKDPARRHQRAADAAWALIKLGEAIPGQLRGEWELTLQRPQQEAQPTAPQTQPDALEERLTWTLEDGDDALGRTLTALQTLQEAPTTAEILAGPRAPRAMDAPPTPSTWRHARSAPAPMQLVGTGLGLYGLRQIPLVGRTGQRDQLWEALLQARQQQQPRAVIVQGGPGVGKSRLLEWFTRRAHELGAATVLRATHSPGGGPSDGLPRMAARHLGCVGLPRPEILGRLQSALRAQQIEDAYEWEALTELISPTHERDPQRTVRFNSPTERYVLLRRLLERQGRQRPTLVWLDDVQWGSDALAFASYVLETGAETGCPVVLLLAAREPEPDALDQPWQQTLRRLAEHPQGLHIELGPLPDQERSTLVQELLGLEGELARQVEERTAGNPLFAVQLVGDWVQRGVLVPGPRGFVLRQGERAILPDDIHQVWAAHLARLLRQQPADAHTALELAAALGQEVEPRQWAQACQLAGLSAPDQLLGLLYSARLAVPSEQGWGFTHGMLRESLERTAREARRWQQHHQICARLLLGAPEGQRGVAARLGRHYLEAGQPELALEPLLRGAHELCEASDYGAAHQLLDLRQRAITALALPPSDERWGRGWMLRSLLHRYQWEFEAAARVSQRAVEQARLQGWDALLPEILWGQAWIARQQGDRPGATALYQQSLELSQRRGDKASMARALKGLGITARQQRQRQRAQDFYSRAHDLYDELGDLGGVASCLYGLGSLAQQRGDGEQAQRLIEKALRLSQRLGDQHLATDCLNVLAEVARSRGDLDTAAAGYRRALELFEAIGSQGGMIPRLNLCIVLLERGHLEEARPILRRALAQLERNQQRDLMAFVHLALCAATSRDAKLERWDHHAQQAQRLLADTGMVDKDVARVAERGAQLLEEAQQPQRARLLWQVAQDQWTALGHQEQAQRAAQRVALSCP